MSQQQEASLPPHEGDQLSRAPPVGGIQADEIIATNVANIIYIHCKCELYQVAS